MFFSCGKMDVYPVSYSQSTHVGWSNKFTQCAHRPLSRTEQRKKKWLEAGSTAFAALEAIIEDKTLLKDMAHITGFHHTGNVEVYHSVMTKYCPKREHFDFDAMCARTQLAVLDHNSNVGRPQATTRTGELRYTRAYTKQRGQWVARKVYAKKSYVYLHSLLDDCQSAVEGRLELPSLPERDLPATIAKVTHLTLSISFRNCFPYGEVNWSFS